METVKFTQMKDGDRADYELLIAHEAAYARGTADRLLNALVDFDEIVSGYKITRLGHSLQSATRAWRSGADVDWIVSALLHDIGDALAPSSHSEFAAAILRPFVREQCAWVVEKHAIFQTLYYGEQLGMDPHKREAYRDSVYFDDCAEFCEAWDQASFDPAYPTKPLSFFAPMVKEVFGRHSHDPAFVRPGAREPLSNPAMVPNEG